MPPVGIYGKRYEITVGKMLSKLLKKELWRKAVHLSSLWMPYIISVAEKTPCLLLFTLLLTVELALEYAACRRVILFGSSFRRLSMRVRRVREMSHIRFVPSGAAYVLLSAILCMLFFKKEAASAALGILFISDAAAALYGRFFGRWRFKNGKTAEGTAAFLISAVPSAGFFMPSAPLSVLLCAAVLAGMAEFYAPNIRINDNLLIPIAAGMILNHAVV